MTTVSDLSRRSRREPDLQDATLLTVGYEWASRTATLCFETAGGGLSLCFSFVTRLDIPHTEPRGPSTSVRSWTWSPAVPSGTRYAVKMRSGDEIVIYTAEEGSSPAETTHLFRRSRRGPHGPKLSAPAAAHDEMVRETLERTGRRTRSTPSVVAAAPGPW